MFLTKELRKRVHFKYCGKCAYCGKDIEYKNMQVDHLVPKERFHVYAHDLRYGINDIENLMPSCRRCNHYKRVYILEEFRRLMTTLHERITEHYINKVAIDYGIIKLKPFDGKFYFEKP